MPAGASQEGGQTGRYTKRCGACGCRPRASVSVGLRIRLLPAFLLPSSVACLAASVRPSSRLAPCPSQRTPALPSRRWRRCRPCKRSRLHSTPALSAGGPQEAGWSVLERVSKIGFVSGHDFSRGANAAKSARALAPEGLQLPNPEPFLKHALVTRSPRHGASKRQTAWRWNRCLSPA